LDGFEVAPGNQQAMAGKQRTMVEKRNGVLVLEDPETVVLAGNFTESAVFVEWVGWCAHMRLEIDVVKEEVIRPA
jgi:hypothetical protein